jgi:hypothetical protein
LRPTIFSDNTIKLDMEITIPDEFKVTYPPGMEEFPLYVRSGNVTTRFLCIPICGGNYIDLISHGPNNPILRGEFPIGITTKAAPLSAEAWMNFGFPPPGPPPPWYGDPNNPGSGFDYVSY